MSRLEPALLLAGSGATPRPTSPADRAQIRQARIAQNRAMAAGDAAQAAAFWTDDVSLRRGLGQLVSGKADYQRLLAPAGNRDSGLVYEREPTGIDMSPNWPLRPPRKAERTRADRGPLLGAVGEARWTVADPVRSVRGAQLRRHRLPLCIASLPR